MIAGSVNQDGELVIPLRMPDANGHLRRLEAVIDTGFNGEITMPPLWISELGLAPGDPVVVTMANNESETFATYYGTVIWDGRRLPVQVIAAEGRILVGTDLLWDNLLSAEITDYGAVTISPLPSPGSSPDDAPQ